MATIANKKTLKIALKSAIAILLVLVFRTLYLKKYPFRSVVWF